jgi:hypothetical protein
MTYPPHQSVPVRRHSTPVPPLPDYGRIRRPARADEHLPVAAGYGYDERPAPAFAPALAPDFAPDDRFHPVAPAYHDDDYATPEPYDNYGQYDQPGYPGDHDGGWDDDYRYDDEYQDQDQYDDEWDDEDWGPPRTNPMAKWGLGLAFFFSPLGLIFSTIGLIQAGRRGERGRGLAIAGLIISLISITVGLLYGVSFAKDLAHRLLSDTASSVTAPAPEGAGSAPAQAQGPAPATVLDACNSLMPALVNADQQMSAATTPEQVVQGITGMRNAVLQAGGAPDPAFQQHVQALATGLQQINDAVTTGTIPPNLMQTLQDASVAVGTDCGMAGWTQ